MALLLTTLLSACGCALDPGEKKDSSYIEGCWDHLRNGRGSSIPE